MFLDACTALQLYFINSSSNHCRGLVSLSPMAEIQNLKLSNPRACVAQELLTAQNAESIEIAAENLLTTHHPKLHFYVVRCLNFHFSAKF